MQKWEYLQTYFIDDDAPKDLIELGDQGWELVAVSPSYGISEHRAYVIGACYTFKRPAGTRLKDRL